MAQACGCNAAPTAHPIRCSQGNLTLVLWVKSVDFVDRLLIMNRATGETGASKCGVNVKVSSNKPFSNIVGLRCAAKLFGGTWRL